MILAAGMGTRLEPLTSKIPKALVPVRGTPMLQHVILKIKAAGFTNVTINIHHFGEQIIDFLASKNNFGLNIDISDERNYLLDTGGGIKHASRFLDGDEPFLVHNVDIISDVDLMAMYKSHISSNALVTLLVSQRRSARQLLFDKDEHLCGWRNNETGEVKSFFRDINLSDYTEYAFGGIHVISPEIFRFMEEWTGKFSIIDFYLSVCFQKPVRIYMQDKVRIIDAGKIDGLKEAKLWLAQLKNSTRMT